MYRSVAHTSQVDESLFGKDSGRNGTMTKGRRTVTGPLAPSSIVISADELNRIRNGSVIKTEAEIAADKEHAERLKEEREKLSKERKDRMKELEKRSVMLAKKSDVEIAEIARNKAIRNMAEKKLDENADVVKLLNSMAQRATAFTIRDQQLEEKERLAKLEKEYDERLDVMIEIDRVQDIMKREHEEQYRKTKRVEDRKVINEQIAARERMRMLSLEAREQENQAMRNMMKRYEDEDRTQAAARAIEMEKSRKAVLLANADAIERKKQAREMEKKEMEDILIYQALKDQELARREEEEEAIARSKKERQAKLLAQQEKAQNNAGKMDELRARRAAEEKERNERKKEKAEALKRKQEMKILLESRAKQAADKLERQHSAKLQADEAVLMDMEYTRKMDERERREKAIKEARMEEHRIQLHAQIEERERRRRQTPEDNSGNIREELIREEAKLAVIRDQMVKDLIAQGVNPKYLSEMRNVDIGKILKR